MHYFTIYEYILFMVYNSKDEAVEDVSNMMQGIVGHSDEGK